MNRADAIAAEIQAMTPKLPGGREPRTAQDWLELASADPMWIARRDAALARFEAALVEDEAPIRTALAAVGVRVDSVWDLVNRRNDYDCAVPSLMTLLRDGSFSSRTREGLARALAIPAAQPHWPELRRMFCDQASGELKNSIACARAGSANATNVAELLDLLADPAHGESRILLLRGLSKLAPEEQREHLRRFATDPVLGQEASKLRERSRDRRRRS